MMKIITAILPILAALLLSCTSTDNDGNTFDIQLSGKGCNNLMARLYRETDSGLVIVDSARFEMQKGHLKGRLQHPELMYIYVDNASDYLPVFVENAHIEIEINFARPSRSVVIGTESNKIFTDFLQSYKSYRDKESGNLKMLQNAYSNFDTVMIERLEAHGSCVAQQSHIEVARAVEPYVAHILAHKPELSLSLVVKVFAECLDELSTYGYVGLVI